MSAADVGAGLGLGHRDRLDVAVDDAGQHLLLLLVGAEALVGAADDLGDAEAADRRQAARGLLEEEAQVDEAAARAAVLLRRGDAEPAELGHLLVEVLVVRVPAVVGQRVALLARAALALAEVAHGGDEVLLLVGQIDHGAPSMVRWFQGGEQQVVDLLAGQPAPDEPLEARGLGEGGVGAQGRAQARVAAERLTSRSTASSRAASRIASTSGSCRRRRAGQPGLAVALDHRQPAVDRGGEVAVLGRERRVAQHRAHDLEVEVALGAEVVVQQAARDAGLAGDLGRGDLARRALGEQPPGGREDLLAALVVLEPGPGCWRGANSERDDSIAPMLRLAPLPLAAVVLAACGTTEIDIEKAKTLITDAVTDQIGAEVDTVECPAEVEAKAGGTFECTVTATDGTKGDGARHPEGRRGQRQHLALRSCAWATSRSGSPPTSPVRSAARCELDCPRDRRGQAGRHVRVRRDR